MEREDAILEGLLKLAKKTTVNNSYQIPYEITKDTDMWFVMLPQWSHYLPPFNIARLSSILLEQGYHTRCLDLNIKAWNIFRPHVDEYGIDPWDGSWTFKWKTDEYWEELHPHFEELFLTAIEEIVKAKPKVIGFTVYWTNTQLVLWMKNILKERLPDTIFVGGGPSSQSDAARLLQNFDILVVGEAEKIILSLLNSIEDNSLDKSKLPQLLTQPFDERIDLNIHPIPNFSDFDVNEYKIPNATISEFSRGCTAKCTFCEETHFWNFRQRGYLSLVDELEHLYNQYGMTGVWFMDSLVNGSLKELKMFSEEVVKRKLPLQWFGFARHDGRMDLEYLQILKDGGCVGMQFGSETGSNKVLEDMKKRVTKEEMEQNFIDCAKVGIEGNTSWVISFPTESILDFVDTITLIWRNRNTSIANIIGGTRFFANSQAIVGQNFKRFELYPFMFEECHIREDLTMGKPQILIRSKTWSIFQHELVANRPITYLPRPNLKSKHYSVKYNNRKLQNNVEFESEFDYNIYNTGNPWKDSCVNQPFGFFRFLWKARGGYEMTIMFNQKDDYTEYGPSLDTNLEGELNFKISDSGKWTYKVDLKFTQRDNAYAPWPWEFYTGQTASILRARKFAKAETGMDGWTDEMVLENNKQIKHMNDNVNLSFEVHETLEGDWAIKKETKSLF